MGQLVKVSRELRFAEYANTAPNIVGVPMTQKKFIDFGFEGTSTLYGWSSTTGSYGGTLAHASVDGGAMTFTMGGVAEDEGEFYHTAQWSPAFNCGMETKVKISGIANVDVCVGFVDQAELTDNHVAMEIASAALRSCTVTQDFVGMIFDTGATSKVWYCGASNNTAEGTPVAAVGSLAPVADTYFKVRVQTDSAGNVTFYYASPTSSTAPFRNDLVPVGYLPAAIAYASTNLLAPYIGFIDHTTGSKICTVSRVTVWQDN